MQADLSSEKKKKSPSAGFGCAPCFKTTKNKTAVKEVKADQRPVRLHDLICIIFNTENILEVKGSHTRIEYSKEGEKKNWHEGAPGLPN